MLTFLQKVCAPRGTKQIMMASQRGFATVAPHSRMPSQKDYYTILDVTSDATPE